MKVTKVQTETVMSGKEMLARVAQEYFDMILLDHMMPELDGIETLHGCGVWEIFRVKICR